MALPVHKNMFDTGFKPSTPTKLKKVDLIEQMCLRCSKRILIDLAHCEKQANTKCTYCSKKSINKPCLEVPVAFHARVNALCTIRDVIVEEGRIATAGELQQQKEYTKSVEQYALEAGKSGVMASPTKAPKSSEDYLGLMLSEMRGHNLAVGETVVAQKVANEKKQTTNDLLAGISTALGALNSAYRQAHGLDAEDAPPRNREETVIESDEDGGFPGFDD